MKKYLFTVFLLLMFVFRLWLAFNAKHGDMYNSLDWGYGALKYGLPSYYELPQKFWPHSRPNQPPGSIYLHLASVSIGNATNNFIHYANTHIPIFPSKLVWWWDWNGELVTIKLPPIIGDFAIVAAILTIGKLTKKYKQSFIVSFVYLINPALWYSSAFWGHTDAAVSALAIWSFVTLFQKRTILSPVLLALSFFIKASWLFIVPFYLLYYLIHFRKYWYHLFVAPIVIFILTIPFHPNIFTLPLWFADLYIHRFLPGDYTWITILAFNFWNLVFAPMGIDMHSLFLGIPANIFGWAVVGISVIVLGIKIIRNPKPKTWIWVATLLSFVVFLFAPKMIHRYLYPAFPLFSLAMLFTNKVKRFFVLYIVMSGCYLINMYYQWWAPGNIWLESLYTDQFMKIISIIYLATFSLLCFMTPVYEKE